MSTQTGLARNRNTEAEEFATSLRSHLVEKHKTKVEGGQASLGEEVQSTSANQDNAVVLPRTSSPMCLFPTCLSSLSVCPSSNSHLQILLQILECKTKLEKQEA